MKKMFYTLALLAFSLSAAGTDNYLSGARAAAMGQSGVALEDLWSVSHNQAGLASLTAPVAGCYFENRFLVSELALKSFAVALPVRSSGVLALHASQFGYSRYHESKAGLAFGRKLGERFSAGVQLDVLSVYIAEGYGTQTTFAVEGGFLAEPLDGLKIGVHVYNPTRARLAEYGDERLPVLFRAGASYKFSDKVLWCAEAEKDLEYAAVFRSGLEYHPSEPFYIRAGMASGPALVSMGFGFRLNHLVIDVASSYHDVLGFSPQFGLAYELSKP
jgi:hypothetical protein